MIAAYTSVSKEWRRTDEAKVKAVIHRTWQLIMPGSCPGALSSLAFGLVVLVFQEWAKVRFPGSMNMQRLSCVLLPAAGWRTQLFRLIFIEPGIRI